MKKINKLNIFIFIVVIIGFYMIWPVPFWLANKRVILPAINTISNFGRNVFSIFYDFGNVLNLAQKNKDLEKENLQLQAQITGLKEKEATEKLLKRDLAQKPIFLNESDLAFAKVVGRSSTSANFGFLINQGSSDGLKNGYAVLSNGYLVDTLKNINPNESEVLLITNFNSLIPVVFEKTRMTGLLRGGINGLVVEDIPFEGDFQKDEVVLTSGLGETIPAGIPIGKSLSMQNTKGDLFAKISVSSPIVFSKIEIVEVVK